MKNRLIIVDDMDFFTDLLKEIIEEDPGWEVVAVTTKKDFFDALKEGSFNLALIDITIEKQEDGLEILNMLSVNNMLPAVALSAYPEALYALRCLKIGAKGYIGKEHICEDLMLGLNQIIDGHLFVSGKDGKSILSEHKKQMSLAK